MVQTIIGVKEGFTLDKKVSRLKFQLTLKGVSFNKTLSDNLYKPHSLPNLTFMWGPL